MAIPVLVETFWIPVAAIVPVIGVALILEARYAANEWGEFRLPRWINVAIIFTYSAALTVTEFIAIDAMARQRSHAGFWLAFASSSVVAGVLYVLALPAASMLLKGWWDMPLAARERLSRRSFRREVQRIRRTVNAAQGNVDELRRRVARDGIGITALEDELAKLERTARSSLTPDEISQLESSISDLREKVAATRAEHEEVRQDVGPWADREQRRTHDLLAQLDEMDGRLSGTNRRDKPVEPDEPSDPDAPDK